MFDYTDRTDWLLVFRLCRCVMRAAPDALRVLMVGMVCLITMSIGLVLTVLGSSHTGSLVPDYGINEVL